MPITWCTDPSQGSFDENSVEFSSYYQYDTVSLKLVRIRLELGRDKSNAENGDSGATQLILNDNRAVGFTPEDMLNNEKYPADGFTTYKDALYANNSLLSQTPTEGDWVVDMSDGDTVPHYGTQVILKPNLPPGIETKHLSLLANQALIDGNDVVLTDPDATAADLSAALQARVSKIMGKEFGAITDGDLLTKLTSQMTTIREQSSQADQNTVTDSLKNVDPLIQQLEEAITDGLVTPNEDLTNAFDSYKSALDTVRNSMNESTRTEAIGELQAAHWTLATAFQEVEQQQMDTYQQSFDSAKNGIQQAQAASERMDDIEKSYENTENAASISDYEDSMKQVNETTEAE